MKFNKKQNMMLSFIVGAIMFTSTALVEINSKSGYEQCKDVLKYTATSLSDGTISNYTVEKNIIVKDNGQRIAGESSLTKYDVVNKAIEVSSSGGEGIGRYKYYSYMDHNTRIDSTDKGYRVTNNLAENKFYKFPNPFDRGDSLDLEKIIDSAIGELKDYVIVSEDPNGTKELVGEINEVQIPTEVNALISYMVKSKFGQNYDEKTQSNKLNLYKDIFVKSAKASIDVCETGTINRILALVTVSGKDEENRIHTINLEILLKLTNINKTVVQKPNLEDPNILVEYSNYQAGSEKIDINIYVGTYKNDITIVKNGEILKIGERTVEINSLSTESISIVYSQIYKEGYEDSTKQSAIYKFTGEQTNSNSGYGRFYSLNYNIRDLDSNKSTGKINFESPSQLFFIIDTTNYDKSETNYASYQRVLQ